MASFKMMEWCHRSAIYMLLYGAQRSELLLETMFFSFFFFFPPTGLNQCKMSCVHVSQSRLYQGKKKKIILKTGARARVGLLQWEPLRPSWILILKMALQIFNIPAPIRLTPAGASQSEVFSYSTNF